MKVARKFLIVVMVALGTLICGFHKFAVTKAVSHAIFYGDFDFVPVARSVMLEIFIGSGEKVIAALKLWAAEEDAAVGVGRRAEFQAEDEIFRKILGGGKLLN